MDEERHPVAGGGARLARYVDRVGLEAALILARAVGRVREAALREVVPLAELEVRGHDPVHPAGLRHAAVVGHVSGELPEADVREERGDVALGERVTLRAIPPPGGVGYDGRALRRRLDRLVEAERHVEEGGRLRRRPRAAGVRRVRARLREQIALRGLVPQADAGGEPYGVALRVPLAVRHPHPDLAAFPVHVNDRRRAAHALSVRGVHEVGHELRAGRVNGQEKARRRAHVGAVRERPQLALPAADRDRKRHE